MADKNGVIPNLAGIGSGFGAVLRLPFRREILRPWFTPVLRIGHNGGEETFLDPEPFLGDPFTYREFWRATRKGELYLFFNDAVLGIPGLFDVFYRNNSGSVKVLIEAL